MLRDITLGQYYPADSILHRLDPRVKFVGTIVYVVSLFLFHNWGYLLGTVFLAVMIKLSKVPFKFITCHVLIRHEHHGRWTDQTFRR